MSQQLYSAMEVAQRLGLHVRTVRNYVRDRRLKAVRIGKQYRIAREDLEAMVGRPVSSPVETQAEPRERNLDVSSIVQIDAIDPETAIRITNLAIAAANSREQRLEPLRVDTIYDQRHERLKIVVNGGIVECARMLGLIKIWMESNR